MKPLRRLLVAISAIMVTGCGAIVKENVKFNPLEPLRVAVIPFAFADKNGNIIDPDKSLFLDNVGVISSKLKEGPNQYLQKLVQNNLSKTSLDLISPAIVDAQISHHGYLRQPDLAYDLPKLFTTDPKVLCSTLLSCDAVLYGKVTRWDRSYYGIQSVATVSLQLRLVSARDNRVLFTSSVEDSDSRGLSKGPTGFSDLVIEPIRGLSNSVITELAAKVADKSLNSLYVKNRPEFLQSAPPAIVASSHDALDGTIKRNHPLTVVMLGTPGQQATFSIGAVIQNVPMAERDSGHYIGEYHPLLQDRFTSLPIYVHLMDQYGRETSQLLGRQQVQLP